MGSLNDALSNEEKEHIDNFFQNIESELQVIMSLDHPNIIKLHQVVYDNKFINIVTEMVRGITLTDLLSP